jgi:hypothetical protein
VAKIMSSNNSVPLVLDFNLLEMDISHYINWFPERHAMMLTVGGTGSGKSYYCKLLMGKISRHLPDSQLFLCDFKDIDFREFSDCPRRWSYEDCTEGLENFYESFKARLDGSDTTNHRKFLVFDEWAAYVMSREKKAMEEVKQKLSTLLMMGRGVGHSVLIFLQRADATLFPLGGRDQFGVIMALGNLSKEQKLMLFPDAREQMGEVTNDRGQGFISLDGEGLKRCVVPSVTDVDKLNTAIRDALTR